MLCPAVISILHSKVLCHSILHMQILYCHLVCLSVHHLLNPFSIACASGTQSVHQQECPWYFYSISSISALPQLQCMAVFYSAHGGIQVAFVDFVLSLCSLVLEVVWLVGCCLVCIQASSLFTFLCLLVGKWPNLHDSGRLWQTTMTW